MLKPWLMILPKIWSTKCTSKEVIPSKASLMAPKDKDPLMKKSGVIYRYKCDRVECDEEYIGESSRTSGERFKEHQKAPSPYLTIITPLVITSV